MDAKNTTATEPAQRVLVIERIFDAPRSLVFKAWTEPERLMRWWGPNGVTTVSCKMDLRAGGAWRISMRCRGNEERQQGVFREIVEPERLVFTYAFEDPTGKPGHENSGDGDFRRVRRQDEANLEASHVRYGRDP